jgi:hypothetical protein
MPVSSDTAVMPDAYIQTGTPVNQLVPACGNSSASPGDSNSGDSNQVRAQQSGIVKATPNGTGNPFKMVTSDTITLCYVGTVLVTCTGSFPFGTLNVSPESYVSQIANYAGQAGGDPRLMLAILWNESNKVHGGFSDQFVDPLLDSAACAVTGSNGCAGPSLGIADMKEATFNQVKKNHPDIFGSSQWNNLTGSTDLAIQALAWELRDLQGQVPAANVGNYSPQQVLGMAYNGGAGLALDYARGGNDLSSDTKKKLQWYADQIGQNWSKADQIFCSSGAFTCTSS